MPSTKPRFERRRHSRFKVLSDAFVILKPSDTAVGRIIDISMDGLTFEYLLGKGRPNEPTELEIVVTDGTFHFNHIPCKAIWDLTTYESPHTSTRGKRCGVQFGDLTDGEQAQLEHFIEKHTDAASISQSYVDAKRTDRRPAKSVSHTG